MEDDCLSGSKMTSVNVDLNLHNLAKAKGIGLKDALEFGIVFKLADKGEAEYPESRLLEKMRKFQYALEEVSQELNDLKKRKDFIPANELENPADEFDKIMANNYNKEDITNG